jgi:predicted transcriptional regulator
MDGAKTTLSTYVPADLAQAVARLADEGNRSVSREVAQALREHVAGQGFSAGTSSPQTSAGVSSAAASAGVSAAGEDAA